MKLSEVELLRRLGAGESVSAVAAAAGVSRTEFDRWWRGVLEARCPSLEGRSPAKVSDSVEIERDRWGVPHIYARCDADLFFGFGYAMAQDRLFQLDYLRRKGLGRLAEILGPDKLELDLVARTVGLNRIARAEWERLTPEVQQFLQSFSDGVNAQIEDSEGRLPIEFALLDYRPAPWTPIDCLAIENEFRWYLTGRFPVIVIPELAKRALGEGPLYREFLLGEADEESILHSGEYAPRDSGAELPSEPVGRVAGDPDGAVGSNNWVISGSRTETGHPLLANDPHIAFEAVSCWYQVHLCGGSFNVAGTSYVGIPAVMFGRNERVAWGITNNICSLRDLYQEKTDPAHPGCFHYDGRWELARELVETIQVRDADPVSHTIRFSRNGPIVDKILPPAARRTGPVALKWLGASQGGWLTGMLAMDRASNVDEFREALRPWHVPTFNLVAADVDGRIAMQSAGRIPIRRTTERGYRPGWDPEHQWQGLIPFEAMPRLTDPPRGWIATANNRLAPDDYPYPLAGCWSSAWRAMRIRQLLEPNEVVSLDDMRAMHQDTKSLRAEQLVPALVAVLSRSSEPQVGRAVGILESWNFHVEPDSVPATLFNVFFSRWCTRVAAARFHSGDVELMAAAAQGCAGRLFAADPSGWFEPGEREAAICEMFNETLSMLAERFGPNMAEWTWSRLHRMPLRHVLSPRGELAALLDHGGEPVRGDIVTVCNTGSGPDWTAATGGGARLIADMGSSPPALLSIDAQSQSGHPGSPHYGDQFNDWNTGSYHKIPLDREAAAQAAVHKLTLVPAAVR